MTKQNVKKANFDKLYIQLYRRVTNKKPYQYGNSIQFARLLQDALDKGFPVDYVLSDGFLAEMEQKGKATVSLRNKTLLYQVMDSGVGDINAMSNLLIDIGADVNIIDTEGRNTLICMAEYKMSNSNISKVIRKTSDINRQDKYHRTAFGIICYKWFSGELSEIRAKKLLSLLIDAGANFNVDDTVERLKRTKSILFKQRAEEILSFIKDETIRYTTQQGQEDSFSADYEYTL